MIKLYGGPYAVCIGLDWADTKHDVCIVDMQNQVREYDCVEHRVDKIEAWVSGIYQRFGGPVAIMLELTRGPIFYALQKYDFVTLFPVNPSALAKYRKFLHPSGAKDDVMDAELIVDVVLRHPDQFAPVAPQSEDLRLLLHLVEHRRQVVRDKVRLTNRLCSTLKQYYPQPLDWFENRGIVLFCDFIKQWPTPHKLQQARSSTLLKFFRAHHSYRSDVNDRRIASIKRVQPLTTDQAVISTHERQALLLVEQLRLILKAISEYDEAIDEVASKHRDYPLFAKLPGAGSALAPRLLVAFGERRERYRDAQELQMYAGIAPVKEQSGQKEWIHWRSQCPKFLRQTFVEWASHSIGQSYWAGVYYRQQRKKGKSHQTAVRALAFKWIRIVYCCWKTRTHYDESKYLAALERRGSPLVRRDTVLG